MRIDRNKPGFLAVLQGAAGRVMQVYAWAGLLVIVFLLAAAFWTVTAPAAHAAVARASASTCPAGPQLKWTHLRDDEHPGVRSAELNPAPGADGTPTTAATVVLARTRHRPVVRQLRYNSEQLVYHLRRGERSYLTATYVEDRRGSERRQVGVTVRTGPLYQLIPVVVFAFIPPGLVDPLQVVTIATPVYEYQATGDTCDRTIATRGRRGRR
jgi:hypothetical protein